MAAPVPVTLADACICQPELRIILSWAIARAVNSENTARTTNRYRMLFCIIVKCGGAEDAAIFQVGDFDLDAFDRFRISPASALLPHRLFEQRMGLADGAAKDDELGVV